MSAFNPTSENSEEENAAELIFGRYHSSIHPSIHHFYIHRLFLISSFLIFLICNTSTFADKDNVETLSNDELYWLMLRRANNPNISEQYSHTFSYVEKLATTKIQDDLQSLGTELKTQLESMVFEMKMDRKLYPLHKFQISAIMNLVRAEETSVEEVVMWIPSLGKFNEEHLAKAINMIVEAKQKVVEANAG